MGTVLSIDLSRAAGAEPDGEAALLSAAIATIGTPRFKPAFAQAVYGLFAADHMTLMAFHETGDPEPILVSSQRAEPLLQDLTDQYARGAYRLDPNLPLIMDEDWTSDVKVVYRPTREYDERYRRQFFSSAHVIEKLSMIWRRGPLRLAINCYAGRRGADRLDGDVDRIARHAPVLSSIATRHCEIIGHNGSRRGIDYRALVDVLSAARAVRLTPREAQVCCGILEGRTTEAISLTLGIAPSSVSTFRKSLYRKLGIGSQGELFALAFGNLWAGAYDD